MKKPLIRQILATKICRFLPFKTSKCMAILGHIIMNNFNDALSLINAKNAKGHPEIRVHIINEVLYRLKYASNHNHNELNKILNVLIENDFVKYPKNKNVDYYTSQTYAQLSNMWSYLGNNKIDSNMFESFYQKIDTHEDLPFNLFMMTLNLSRYDSAIHTLERNKIFKFFEKDIINSLQKENIVDWRPSVGDSSNNYLEPNQYWAKIVKRTPCSLLKELLPYLKNQDNHKIFSLIVLSRNEKLDLETIELIDKIMDIESIIIKNKDLSFNEKLEKLEEFKALNEEVYNYMKEVISKKFQKEIISEIDIVTKNQAKPKKNIKLI